MEELSTAKIRMDQMMNELAEEYRSNLKEKDDEICTLKQIADQSKVHTTED